MKYVLLVYRDEQQWEVMSAGERKVFVESCRANEQDMRQSHHLVDIETLQSDTTLTVRVVSGRLSLTDGPVADTEQQLVQLLIVKAKDLNQAIQVASKMPQARGGPIEVRPVVESKLAFDNL
jgi:hypothetical protein